MKMGLYDAFRDKPFQTAYGENKTAVTVDVLEVGLILAFVLLALSFLVVLPGFRHKEVRQWRYCSHENLSQIFTMKCKTIATRETF